MQIVFVRQASDLGVCTGYPQGEESVKKQKDINDKRFSFVLAFESVAGRAKRLSLDLLFRFASRQNEKIYSNQIPLS